MIIMIEKKILSRMSVLNQLNDRGFIWRFIRFGRSIDR